MPKTSMTAFEETQKIHYFTKKEREERGLKDHDMIVGTGVCPLCKRIEYVALDSGFTVINSSFCYFTNHTDKTNNLCAGSEQTFSILDKMSLYTGKEVFATQDIVRSISPTGVVSTVVEKGATGLIQQHSNKTLVKWNDGLSLWCNLSEIKLTGD